MKPSEARVSFAHPSWTEMSAVAHPGASAVARERFWKGVFPRGRLRAPHAGPPALERKLTT